MAAFRDALARCAARMVALGHAPALVMHGGADEVVPVRDAYALAQAMGTRAERFIA